MCGMPRMPWQCKQKGAALQERAPGLCYNTPMASSFKRSFAISGGLIILTFAAFGFIFHLVGNKLAAEATAITNARALISHSTGASERLAILKKDQPIAEGYQRIITLLLPPQENLLDLPRDIESIGRLHQVAALLTFSATDDPSTNPNAGTLGFSITANGSGVNLINFLKQLEVSHTKYTIGIDSMDITGSDPAAQQLLATGRVFFYH